MTKLEFELLVDEILNEFYCKLERLKYKKNMCKITFNDCVFYHDLYVPYRFMNLARLRVRIMKELNLLTPVDTEIL